MSRKKKLILNTGVGIIKQLVTIVCGFILPRYMLLYYGSYVNGMISSMTHFLSFISMLDMGVGAVINANLYKPLANKDAKQISLIIKSSERFFRRLAYIFIVYIIILCFVFPTIVDENIGVWYTISLLLIISTSTLAQYLFGMTYHLLLNADQKAYIPLTIQSVTIAFNTIISIFLMRIGVSVHIVKLVSALVFILRPLGQMLYVNKRYDINRKVVLVEEPIKQKWNGFSQHLASVICQNIDVAVLTLFSTLENVSVYTVYYNVIFGVEQMVATVTYGLEAFFGNMIAKKEDNKLQKAFESVEWLIHTGVCFLFIVMGIMLIPFISIYTKGINDTNYIFPLFGLLLVVAYGMKCLRLPYFVVVKAAGHFRETQNGAYISAGLNIIVTVILVFKYGLVGVALGTFVAMFYHTCYFVWYLRIKILNRSILIFVKYLLTDIIMVLSSYYFTRRMIYIPSTYIEWMIIAVKVSIVVLLDILLINILFYSKRIKSTFLGKNK